MSVEPARGDRQRSPVAQQLVRDLMIAQALRYLDRVASWPVVTTDYTAVRTAIEAGLQNV